MSALYAHPFFGIFLSIVAFAIGIRVQKALATPLANSLLVATILIVALIVLTPVTLEGYQVGGSMINLLVIPATLMLSVKIHRLWALTKRQFVPILLGCLAGSITSLVSVGTLCRLLALDSVVTSSLLPKSVTTAISMSLSENHGGIPAITVAAVVVTGILTAILAPAIIKVFRLKNPVALGVAFGTAGHALGVATAIKQGETEGALSGIALSVTGILTSLIYLVLFPV